MDVKYNELLSNISDGKQMHREEYEYISSFIEKDANLLVFGTGRDTDFWKYQSKNAIFLESEDEWIDKNNSSVFKVEYTTKRPEYKELLEEYKSGNFQNLKMNIPESVLNTKWDVIIVDAPNGSKEHSPGRMQSIYTASILSNTETDVFIHDVQRIVERKYSQIMFDKIITRIHSMYHVKKEKV